MPAYSNAGSANGRQADSESVNLGSNPSPAAKTGGHVTTRSAFTPSKHQKLWTLKLG